MKPLFIQSSKGRPPQKAGASNSSTSDMRPTMNGVHEAIVECERCPRLRHYCREIARVKKRAHQHDTYWGRPVAGFGDPAARLLLIALAPAAHGANRTGRVFTGDGSGGSSEFLMAALHRAGFADRPTSQHISDGLQLTDVFITSAVRCAPPDNTPLPEEIDRCRYHLEAEVSLLPNVRVVIALGRIAFDAWISMLRRRDVAFTTRPQFGHGTTIDPGADFPHLIGCYHPSRQNTNTGRLTPAMLDETLSSARVLLVQGAESQLAGGAGRGAPPAPQARQGRARVGLSSDRTRSS